MWFSPPRWWQVPGFLLRAWTSRAPRLPPVVEAPSPRVGICQSIDEIRRHVARMRPEECCTRQPMVAGGRRTMVCSNGCAWQKLDLLVANASVEAGIAAHGVRLLASDL